MGWRRYLERKRRDEDLGQEIASYIEHETAENLARGMSAEEARRAAQRKFGNRTLVREAVYEMNTLTFLEAVWEDLKHAIRRIWRTPGFTGTVVLTLALSIGVNTAIFSIVNALLSREPPYAQPERIGRIASPDARTSIDGEQWELLRDHVPSLVSAVSAGRTNGANLRAGRHAQHLQAGRVSAHYFDVLALHPVIGRNFSEEEDRPDGPKSVILSYALWRTAFSGAPNVLGQAVLLKGEPHTIVGVLPEGVTTPLNADIYTALQPSREGEGQGTNFTAVVRLRDEATWQQAKAEINRAWAKAFRTHMFAERNPGAPVRYSCVPLQEAETGTLRPQVLALMLAAALILLIACANLAGLTLVRMGRRTSEIATRLALGASRWHVQRQLWIENLLLALVGGSAAVGVGILALRRLLRLLPEHFLPVAQVSLDSRVLAFTLFLSVLTSVLFGMLPALTTRTLDLRASITSRTVIGAGSRRLRQGLIAGEVALTVVLLAAAGLLIRTLIHLQTLPPGFNPSGVVTAKASLDDARYHDPAAFTRLLNESLSAMRRIPGVQDAAVGLTLPYEQAVISGVTVSDGKKAGQEISLREVYVTPRYFETLQIPVRGGRTFTEVDGPDAQPVVVINHRLAQKAFPAANPVGRYLDVDSLDKEALIVGVVADTVLSSAGRSNAAPLTTEETIYLPAAQVVDSEYLSTMHAWFQPSWIVRSASATGDVTTQMQSALASIEPTLPFSGFYSMNDLMATTLATQRVQVALLAAMAALALLLSAVGIFGLMAQLVAQRRREIGIRIALGSTMSRAMIHISRSGVGASAVGLLLGVVLSLGALRAMRSALYGVGVYDAPTILVVVLTLCAVTLLATTIPTLRIARIDAAKTLREE